MTIATIMILALIDSNLLLLTISQLMNYDCFTIKYTSELIEKMFKFSLSVSMVTKFLNVAYSFLQLRYFNSNAARLLTETANFPINNGYTI
jgi:hypothetical protein